MADRRGIDLGLEVPPEGPLAPPGTYTLRLTVDGVRHEQKVVVKNDPRSPATAWRSRLAGAWTAASRSATTAVRSGT